jgi:hypothetical protein
MSTVVEARLAIGRQPGMWMTSGEADVVTYRPFGPARRATSWDRAVEVVRGRSRSPTIDGILIPVTRGTNLSPCAAPNSCRSGVHPYEGQYVTHPSCRNRSVPGRQAMTPASFGRALADVAAVLMRSRELGLPGLGITRTCRIADLGCDTWKRWWMVTDEWDARCRVPIQCRM